MRDGRHDEKCASQNQPWLSFALFNFDYIIKVTASQPSTTHLSPPSFRKQVHIQHGMSNFLPASSLVVVLDMCIPKGCPRAVQMAEQKIS